MAEEEKPKLPRRSRAESTWDETPSSIDRKSLSGMSDSVKAILAPLLGGTKRHSEVKVDLGSDPDSALYDSVPTGTTAMHRYSTVEHTVAAEAASSESGTSSTDTNPKSRPSYVPETSNDEVSASVKINTSEDDSGTSADANPKSRPSYTSRSSIALEKMHRSSDTEVTTTETSPKVSYRRASHFPRKSLVPRRSTVGSKGKDVRPAVYGEASDAPVKTGHPSLSDKVKDAVTGQVPGKGINSGRATRESASSDLLNDLLPGAVRDTLPVQDVGMGGRFSRDAASEPDLVPRHTNGPNEPLTKPM